MHSNVVLRVSRRKNSNMFSWRAFFSCVLDKGFIEVPYLHEASPALKTFLDVCLHSGIIYLGKCSILNVWQCSEYVCLNNCSVVCTVNSCYVLDQTHSEFWHIQNCLFSNMQEYWSIFSFIKAYSQILKYY